MNNLKKDTGNNQPKPRYFRGWAVFVILVLLAGLVLPATLFARADNGSRYHDFDVTFTKWITAYPDMAGVGGGAIGPGTFAGTIQDLQVNGTMEYVHAIYHLYGSRHSFTADINATQNDALGTGTITGTVIGGWLKGARLTGSYTVYAVCPIDTPNNAMGTLCFQGVLHLRRAP